ncbi:glycosyltransferase [Ferruginibacter paludis]|uniref:glycosyltransferase n=1 Tax=Ferruginibacter paludis TaxID=1310417 RepID=UPI0025B5EA59|nr:glycosyltransferase [Ferruginibacter paludis]MDN3658887.1 glycosyltransferase [Ferruginibacter paludis]
MKDNKVCLINLALDIGGAQRHTADLANFLAENDCQVSIILLSKAPVCFKLSSDINLIEPDFKMQRSVKGKLVHMTRLIRYIRKSLKMVDPGVIFNASSPSFLLAATVGLNYPMYLTIRCNPLYTKLIESFSVPLIIRKILYRRLKGIIAQTNFAAYILDRQFSTNAIIVIPNYIRPLPTLRVAKKNQIVSVGRLIKSKGFDYLLRAFALIKNADWKLMIVGDGPESSNLKQLAVSLAIEENVVFTGAKNDVNQCLQESKIFAFTSLSEGFPNALMEAMATPLACISFNCDAGPADIIEDGKSGFLITPKDINAFAEKLSVLMNDEMLRTVFMEEAYKITVKNSLEKIGKRYLDLIAVKEN